MINIDIIDFHGSIHGCGIIRGFVSNFDVIIGRIDYRWYPINPLIEKYRVIDEPFDNQAVCRCIVQIVDAI